MPGVHKATAPDREKRRSIFCKFIGAAGELNVMWQKYINTLVGLLNGGLKQQIEQA